MDAASCSRIYRVNVILVLRIIGNLHLPLKCFQLQAVEEAVMTGLAKAASVPAMLVIDFAFSTLASSVTWAAIGPVSLSSVLVLYSQPLFLLLYC